MDIGYILGLKKVGAVAPIVQFLQAVLEQYNVDNATSYTWQDYVDDPTLLNSVLEYAIDFTNESNIILQPATNVDGGTAANQFKLYNSAVGDDINVIFDHKNLKQELDYMNGGAFAGQLGITGGSSPNFGWGNRITSPGNVNTITNNGK